MSGRNSSAPFTRASFDDLRETIGIPQFSGAAGENWAFVFNGMIFQGGTINVPNAITAFPFNTAFTQQVLGVFLQTTVKGQVPGVSATALDTFTVDHTGTVHDAYWFAIGV